MNSSRRRCASYGQPHLFDRSVTDDARPNDDREDCDPQIGARFLALNRDDSSATIRDEVVAGCNPLRFR